MVAGRQHDGRLDQQVDGQTGERVPDQPQAATARTMIPATFQPSVTYSSLNPRRSSRARTGSSGTVTPRS
jgi:hypothetical protein